MEKKSGSQQKGTIILATVKGDVHTSAKIWSTSSCRTWYKVVNLGIKQAGERNHRAAKEHSADAIGLSGLLVKSHA